MQRKHTRSQLEIGITLAAISRIASGSINEDIKIAYHIVCNKSFGELQAGNRSAYEFYYLYESEANSERFS